MGRSRRPIYGIVAADSRSPRDGRYIEDLGRYNPVKEPAVVSLDEDRILYWMREGAQPSDTVRNILSNHGIMLRIHLERKGKTPDEIEAAISDWKSQHAASGKQKLTKQDRAREALREEAARVEEEEKQEAESRAKAEAKAREEAAAARAKAEAEKEAERESAAAEAKLEQEEANAEVVAAESTADTSEVAETVVEDVSPDSDEENKEASE